MEFSQKEMLVSAFYALIIGVMLGLLYDALRFARALITPKNKRIETAVFFAFDILYSLAVTATFALLVYHTNYGRLRWFIFAGSIVGFTLYRMTLGRLVKLILEWLRSFVLRVVSIILFPIKKLVLVIIKFTKFTIASPIKRIYNKYIGNSFGNKSKGKNVKEAEQEPTA